MEALGVDIETARRITNETLAGSALAAPAAGFGDFEKYPDFATVSIEEPACQKQGCSFIAFAEGLRTGDPKCEDCSRIYRIGERGDRIKRDVQAIEIVRLLESFIVVANSLVDRQGQLCMGTDQ